MAAGLSGHCCSGWPSEGLRHRGVLSYAGEGESFTTGKKALCKWHDLSACDMAAPRSRSSCHLVARRSHISAAGVSGRDRWVLLKGCGDGRRFQEFVISALKWKARLPHVRSVCGDVKYTEAARAEEDLNSAMDAALQVVRDIARFIGREAHLSYCFVSYDLTVTVLPGLLLTLVTHMKAKALFGAAAATAPLCHSLLRSFLWMWLFVYIITLANQTHGEAEDAINKPSRPIPSRLVSVAGAYKRLVWVCSLFLLLGAHIRIAALSALWIASVLTLECWGPSRTSLHWLVKPVAMAIGIFILCVGNPSLVGPIAHHRRTLFFMSAISVAMGLFGSNIQDIRDVEGDRRQGDRVSLPILLGDMPARHLCSFLLLGSWGTIHTALMALSGPYNLATSFAVLVWCVFLCYRTLSMRSPAEDHRTYQTFVVLFSFLQLSYLWVV